jgi:hypothetical protein
VVRGGGEVVDELDGCENKGLMNGPFARLFSSLAARNSYIYFQI